MAKYELGAIYKINGRSGELYYVRLFFDKRLLWRFFIIRRRTE